MEHTIQRGIWRADLNRSEDAIPSCRDLLQRALSAPGFTIDPNERTRVFLGCRLSEQKHDDVLSARRQLQPGHQRGAGVAELTDPIGELLPRGGGRCLPRAVAPQELGAVGRERAGTTRHIGESDPPGEITRPGTSGEEGAALRVERALHMQWGLLAQYAEHPLDIEGRLPPP